MINRFNPKQEESIINYQTFFDPERIMTMNMLEYQYSKGFIYLREKNDELVKKIRNKCGNEINKDNLFYITIISWKLKRIMHY